MIQIFILSFFALFRHFIFVCHLFGHLFCHFFVVSVLSVMFLSFFVISVLACFFLWSFGGTFVILFAIVGHVRAIFSKIWKTIEKLPKK